jgi:exopolysaccharide production protein ExoZ
MRGALACTVMFYHYGLNTVLERLTGGVLRDGAWELCVDFFFILSGFVLARSISANTPTLQQFANRRLFRLAPLFLSTTLVVFALSQERWSTFTVTANVLMVQPFVGVSTVNFPGWSIPFELFLPLGLVAFVPWLNTRRAAVAFTALGVLTICHAWIGVQLAMRTGGDLAFARAATGLLLGTCLHILFQKQNPAGSSWLAGSCVLAVLATMAVAGAVPIAAASFPVLTAVAIWFGARAKGLFSTAGMQELGNASYSIYLVHIPVLYAAQAAFGDAVTRGAMAKTLMVIATIALSRLTYRCFELPLASMGSGRMRHLPRV